MALCTGNVFLRPQGYRNVRETYVTRRSFLVPVNYSGGKLNVHSVPQLGSMFY